MQAFGPLQDPVNTGDRDARACRGLANALARRQRNVRDVRSDGERGDFEGVIAGPGGKFRGIFDFPTLEDLVANAEFHRRQVRNSGAKAQGQRAAARAA